MATVIRGKYKGEESRIHQFCNDWFTLEDIHDVFSPLSLKLDEDEIQEVIHANLFGQTGVMFDEYELRDDGTFKKLKWT